MKNENNTQHTEGKWIVTGEDKNHVSVGTGHFIADCSVFKRFGLMLLLEEQQANAQLIASAPELLKENEQLKEALNGFKKALYEMSVQFDNTNAINAELLEALKEQNNVISGFAGIEAWITDRELKEKWQAKVYPSIQKSNSAIAKAEGKTLGVS